MSDIGMCVMLILIRTACLALLLLSGPSTANFAIFQTNNTASSPSFTPAWQTLAEGDGGQGSGFARASDGTIVSWNNTQGAHLYRATGTCPGWGTNYAAPCWEQLFTATSVTPSLGNVNPFASNGGAISVAICNSSTNVAYALWAGSLWVTQNLQSSARAWLKTTLTTTQSSNLNANIGIGNYLACDPNNPAIAYIATPSNVQVTKNGTSGTPTFATVSGVGTTGALSSAIFFDPASATTGTCPSSCFTNHFYIFTYSTGVFETYNGGTPQSGSFTQTGGSSAPTTYFGMDADKFSQLWVVSGGASVFRYVPNGTAGGGTWSTSTPGVTNSQTFTVAADPTSSASTSNRVVAAYFDGQIAISTNNAGSWTAAGTGATVSATSPQPTWMATANQIAAGNPGVLYISSVSMLFDASGNLWTAGGIANWELTAGNIVNNPVWVANTIGIEQLVGIGVLAPPGNSPITFQWDRAFITINNLDTFPSTYYAGALHSNIYGTNWDGVQGGWGLDYASFTSGGSACGSSCNFFTGWGGTTVTVSASSSDGGNSWTVWPTAPTPNNVGGSVAAASPTNWIVVPGENEPMYYTLNAATSWNTVTVSGSPSWVTGQGIRIPIAADRGNAGTYCAIDTAQNIYSTTNIASGLTKQAGSSGVVDGGVNVDMLIAVPGQPATFFYTGSNANGTSAGSNHIWKITKTTNECDTATKMNTNFSGVYALGFGAAKPGNSLPTIYAYGTLSGVLGMYESDNALSASPGSETWTLINVPSTQQTWPKNSQDFVTYVSGDMNVYGVIYVQFRGSGGGYIQTQNSCPYVNLTTAFKPGSTLSGTTSLQATLSGQAIPTNVSFYYDSTNLIGTQTTATGTPPTYSQSFNTTGLSTGAHTLTVTATNSNCPTANQTYNSFTVPFTH